MLKQIWALSVPLKPWDTYVEEQSVIVAFGKDLMSKFIRIYEECSFKTTWKKIDKSPDNKLEWQSNSIIDRNWRDEERGDDNDVNKRKRDT